MKRHWIGTTAIALGIVALCLSVYLYDAKADLQSKRDQLDEGKSKLTLKFGDREFSFGQKQAPPNLPDLQAELRNMEERVTMIRIAMIAFAGLSLLLVPISWINEKSRVMSISAAVVPVAAISWHFIAAGITIGVAVVVIFLILGALGGSL